MTVRDGTVSEEQLEKRLDLWFFRDLSDDQRLGLFRLCGYPVDEMQTHTVQRLGLRHLVAALARRSVPSEPVADGYLCRAPDGVWASGPEVTTAEYVQAWRDKGYTCKPYYLYPSPASKPEVTPAMVEEKPKWRGPYDAYPSKSSKASNAALLSALEAESNVAALQQQVTDEMVELALNKWFDLGTVAARPHPQHAIAMRAALIAAREVAP